MSRSCFSTFDVEAFAWRRFVWILGILSLLTGPRPGTAQIVGESWYPIGPAPIVGFFSGGTVGRATAIATNPFNADEFWIGGAAGGVWHTRNAGRTWQAIMNRAPSLAVGSIQVTECSAAGCGKIYVGSGENAIRRDTYHGRGIYVGTPGEFSNWNWRYSIRGVGFDFTYGSVVDLALVPGPPGPTTTLLAAVSSGTTVSASEATLTAPPPARGFGIYISEDDAVTWRRLQDDLPTSAMPSNLDLVPSSATGDSVRIYASFSAERVRIEQGGIYRSDDLGLSWRKLDSGFPSAERQALRGRNFDHVELAVAPNDADMLYASVGYCADRLGACASSVDVYRSSDGGDSWQFRGAPSASSYSRYTHALAVAPGDDERIFWGGVPLMRSDDGGETFVSSDAIDFCPVGPMDVNCVPTAEGRPRVHSDMREIVFHAADANRALLTGDGGLAISFDGGIRWVPRNDGLNIVGFHTVAASPHFGALLAGSQDNGMQIWNGEPRWRQAGNWAEDGSASIIDLVEGSPPGNQDVYGGANSGTLQHSGDAGNSWRYLTLGYAVDGARLMYAPAFQDPDPPHAIYTGGNRVYRRPRGDPGAPWTAVSPVLATGTSTEIRTSPTEFTNSITALGLARGSTRVFAGFYLGQVFVSDNPDIDGSWQPTGAGTLPNTPVTWLAVDPDDPDTAYATFSGFGPEPKVWKTDSGGGSWTPISSGLPPGVPVNTVAIEETVPQNVLWIGLDSHPEPSPLDPALGTVFKSVDGGATWLPWSRGLPNVPVFDLEVDTAHGRVIAATHGRGAYLLGFPQLNNYEGWVDGDIWDVPIFGTNFPANQSCTVTLRQADGSECASDTIDAQGGTISTDAEGTLVSTHSSGGIFWYEDRPVAWACYGGMCLDGTPIGDCNDDADGDGDRDPLTSVEVDCTGPLATSEILGCPPLSNPPSAVFNIDGLPDLGGSGGGSGGASGGTAGIVLLSASLEGRGETTSLCSVAVPLEEDVDSGLDFLDRAQQAFASSLTCLAAGVEAEVTGSVASGPALPPGADEDQFDAPRRLHLRAQGLTGGMLVPAVAVPTGELAERCVSLDNLNVPLLGQLKIMTSAFPTGATGASGGHLQFTQMTSLGPCSISLPTAPGQTQGELAQALVDALQTPGIPGPHPQCPSRRNMRDVSRLGDAVVTVSADRLRVCTDDTGIGLQLRPEGLRQTHPVAVARVDRSGSAVTLDGTDSLDADSSPGSRDDIVHYRWFALDDAGLARPLGDGDRLSLSAPLPRRVRLQVTDRHGLSDLAEVDITAGAPSPLPFGVPGTTVFSLHVGGNQPVGSFGDAADSGWSLGLDLERAVGRRTSALLFLRHQRFDMPRRSDLTTTSLAAAVRHYLGSSPWFGFLQGGAGYYDLSRGDGTLGLHAGGGVHLPLPSGSHALEVSLDGHWLENGNHFFLAPEVAFKWRF